MVDSRGCGGREVSGSFHSPKKYSCKMNKQETGEVNEIFKLDFFFFTLLHLRRLMPGWENYGGNFLHSRRRGAAGGAVCISFLLLFFLFLFPPLYYSRTEIIEILLFGKITRVFFARRCTVVILLFIYIILWDVDV